MGEDRDEFEDGEMQASENEVQCPFCGEPFTIVVDTSVDQQTYIEDCYVCCRPIHFTVSCEDGALVSIGTERS